MKTDSSSRTGMCSPQAEWVPCCQAGAGLGAPLRDTVSRVPHKHHPHPVLRLLWVTQAPSQCLGPDPQPQPGSALVVESHSASVSQAGSTWNSPLCLTGMTMSLAFLPGLMEIQGRDGALLYIRFRDSFCLLQIGLTYF